MAYVLEDSYTTTSSGKVGPNGNHWGAQTFTTVGAFILTRVDAYTTKQGSPTTNGTWCVYSTGGDGKPDTELASTTVLHADFVVGGWTEAVFSPGVSLDAETKYAIVFKFPGGSGSVRWLYGGGSDLHPNGQFLGTSNAGSSWSVYSGALAFKAYSGSEIETEDVSATIAGVGSITGTVRVLTTEEVSGTIAGVGAITGTVSATQTSTNVKDSDLKILTRLIAINNDCLYYEDV